MLVAACAAACGQSPLPPRLGGLPRNRMWTGERAERLARQMFGRDLEPRDSIVAEYGRPGQLRVWLARFEDGVRAHQAVAAALDQVRESASPFSRPREESGRPGRWVFVGRGGHHAVWVSHRSVYWVIGDPTRLAVIMGELPPPAGGTVM